MKSRVIGWWWENAMGGFTLSLSVMCASAIWQRIESKIDQILRRFYISSLTVETLQLEAVFRCQSLQRWSESEMTTSRPSFMWTKEQAHSSTTAWVSLYKTNQEKYTESAVIMKNKTAKERNPWLRHYMTQNTNHWSSGCFVSCDFCVCQARKRSLTWKDEELGERERMESCKMVQWRQVSNHNSYSKVKIALSLYSSVGIFFS